MKFMARDISIAFTFASDLKIDAVKARSTAIEKLVASGYSEQSASDLLDKWIKAINHKPTEAQRRRWAREDRAERLREIRAEAYYNQ